jgi:hypothetical protein
VEAVVDVGLPQVEHNRLEEHQAAGRQVDSALAEMQKLTKDERDELGQMAKAALMQMATE